MGLSPPRRELRPLFVPFPEDDDPVLEVWSRDCGDVSAPEGRVVVPESLRFPSVFHRTTSFSSPLES